MCRWPVMARVFSERTSLLAFGLRLEWHTQSVACSQPISSRPYGIDGLLDTAANAWSKVLISRTPRRLQLAR